MTSNKVLKMNYRFSLVILSLLLFVLKLEAQESDLQIGEWKSIIPYNKGTHLAQDDNNVYYASNLGLMIINKETESKSRMTKTEGLSDVMISFCSYDQTTESLVLIYESLIIDIIGPSGIRTNFDLKNYNFSQGVKIINSINTDNNGGLLISSNFGLSRFDIDKEEFSFTARKQNLDIYASTILDDNIYLSSSEGIFFTPQNNPNIDNINTWTLLEDDNYPNGYSSYSIISFNGQLYAGIDNALCKYENGQLTKVIEQEDTEIIYMTTNYNKLMVGFGLFGEYLTGTLFKVDAEENITDISTDFERCFGENRYALNDQYDQIWLGDGFENIRRIENDAGEDYECYIYSNTIAEKGVYDIELNEDEIWVAPGGYSVNYNYLFNNTGLMSYTNNDWDNFTSSDYSTLEGLADISSVEIHPETKDVFFGSYLDGLVHFDRANDTMIVYNDSNSSLNNVPGDDTRTRVSDLSFDDSLNLWVVNYAAERPLSVFKNMQMDIHRSFNLSGIEDVLKITIDQNNYKWLVVTNGQYGLVVYDSGEDFMDESDDTVLPINRFNSVLPTNTVNCVAVDKEGDVWVGTSEGPIVFDCPQLIFSTEGCAGSRRIGETENIGAYLLDTENIKCIGIDGANRKWFGTDNGIFIVSESGDEQLFKIDTDNSPILSNSIREIKFHPTNGEVYIGTDNGISVLRGEAIEGTQFHESIEVFPNPVRPEHSGPIAIRGVSENARVKITTVDGRLVYETTALGGQVVWDGKDLNGNRPATGVYLVFATSETTFNSTKPSTATGKFLFVN